MSNSTESMYMYSGVSIFDKNKLIDFKEALEIADETRKPYDNQKRWWLRTVTNATKKGEINND